MNLKINLDSHHIKLKGLGGYRIEVLKSDLNIHSITDLFHFIPNRYVDRRKFYKINTLAESNAEVQIIGEVTDFQKIRSASGERLKATFSDETGNLELVWFKGISYMQKKLKPNEPFVVYGKLNAFGGTLSIVHPEIESLSTFKRKGVNGILPIYPSTEKCQKAGVSSVFLRQIIKEAFELFGKHIHEALPLHLRDEFGWSEKRKSLQELHFPSSFENLQKAQFSLKFEELFYLQLQLLEKKQLRIKNIKGFEFSKIDTYFNTFYKQYLPFELTGAQKKVLKEIRKDLGSGVQMNRLLQGDVGSGKTMVAVLSSLIAIDNGYQCCIMAPTEILAKQHYNSISELLQPLEINIKILTGSTKKKNREILHDELENGSLQILIGTHALIEDKVVFKNLGLAIIDEQHRFGVAQRSKLWKKSKLPPHVLVMTATPIPRTLAMSYYGDLDLSVIDELPPGRKPISTAHRTDASRLKVLKFVKNEIEKGRQVYFVYPLIKESEKLDYKDLMDGYHALSRDFPMPDYQISIVHGQMKSEDKEFEMQRFIKNNTQIMVATTVIEVGVNIPNASIMVIESAERFGLSQLHQLRGRVGRGAYQSHCILMTSDKISDDSKQRIESMVQTNDGFKLAEIDLNLRGPGDLMGTQQSGALNLKVSDLVKDSQILHLARKKAEDILREDELLLFEKNKIIKNTLVQIMNDKAFWSYIS